MRSFRCDLLNAILDSMLDHKTLAIDISRELFHAMESPMQFKQLYIQAASENIYWHYFLSA